MKHVQTVLLILTISISSFAQQKTPYQGSRIFWDLDSKATVFSTGGGYARIIELKDGRLLCVSQEGPNIAVKFSSDKGATWSSQFTNIVTAGSTNFNLCVPDVIQLSDGTILVGYNPRVKSENGTDRFSIKVVRSTNNGDSWSTPISVFDGGTTFGNGCWEPAFLELPSGEVQCYFADESTYTTTNYQNISMCRSADKGASWGTPVIVSYRSGYRDGMPVPLLLKDLSDIVVIIEDNGWGGGTPGFVATTVRTTLANNWSSEIPVAGNSVSRAKIFEDESLSTSFISSAPYIRQLPSGETIASYQSSENRPSTRDGDRDMHVLVGNSQAGNFKAKSVPFSLGTDQHSVWNSVSVIDNGVVLAVGSIGASATSAGNNDGGPNGVVIMKGYPVSQVKAAYGSITVDGAKGSDEEWTTPNAAQLYMGNVTKNRTTVDFLYDDTYLYLTARVNDKTVVTSGTNHDGIRFFIDANNVSGSTPQAGMYSFFFDANGSVTSPRYGNNGSWQTNANTSGITYKVITQANNYYNIEAAIPWSVLGKTTPPSGRMAIALEVENRESTSSTTTTTDKIADVDNNASWTWLEFRLDIEQTEPENMLGLLPSGVTPVINSPLTNEGGGNRFPYLQKNLVVAGEKSKGYKAFFAATDATNGEELWVTDGTVAGTRLVKNINTGTNSSNVRWLTRFNDKVVFAAQDNTNGAELWISDGTSDGTKMIKNIYTGSNNSSEPQGFTQLNETQFIFVAKDANSGGQWHLWVSDGTETGTTKISTCETVFPGEHNSWHSPYCRVGRKVFFKATDAANGQELWVTDGTSEGTKLVKNINTENSGAGGSAIDNMVNFYNEKLFFKAFSIEHFNEPWTSDGTETGTYEIVDANPGTGNGEISEVAAFPYKGKIYFRGFGQGKGVELACTNPDVKNDYNVFDINQGTENSFADLGVEFDDVFMFCASRGGSDPGQLHYTNGSTVTLQSTVTGSNWVKELTVASGSLYWWNEVNQGKLYRIDNKSEYPVTVETNGSKIHTFRNLGGDLLFVRDQNLYLYHYRKAGFDPDTDTDNLDIEYRTRAEMETVIPSAGYLSAKSYAKSYVGGNIVFESDETSTGQLTNIPSEGLTVKGVVKLEKTFEVSTWYPMGFPFEMAAYRGEGFTDNKDLSVWSSGNGGDFWVKSYNGSNFVYSNTINEGNGYILQFPSAFAGEEVTFISTANPVLYNITENQLNFSTAGYRLEANPSVNNLTLNTPNRYYIYNRSTNNFKLLESGSATIKPFEAFVVAHNIQGPLKSSLNVDEITVLESISVNDPVIKTEYYTLQGIKIQQPQNQGFYFRKKVYASSRIEIEKIFHISR